MSMVMERGEAVIEYKKWDFWLADCGESVGSVQGGVRPVIVISNDIGNKFAPIVIVSPVTSSLTKAKLPTHVLIKAEEGGFRLDSTVLFEQHLTLPKSKLIHKLLTAPPSYENRLREALQKSTD